MDDRLCELCHRSKSKYVCPVCEVLYCSVNCYNNEQHLQCSENFYKKCVTDELELRKKLVPSKGIFDILKRAHNLKYDTTLDSDDDTDDDNDDVDDDYDKHRINYEGIVDNDCKDKNNTEFVYEDIYKKGKGLEDLAKRMENVNLDNEREIWEKLIPSERKEFKKMIQSGEITDILPEWEPWWIVIQPNPLISEINNEKKNKTYADICPPLNVKIPPFTELTKKVPAPSMPFMLANILMSYAYTARWLKGKHADMPVEAISIMFALSSVVRLNKVLFSFSEAYTDFEFNLKNCEWLRKNYIDASELKKDVCQIMKCSMGNDLQFGIKASLCDIYNIINEACKILKNEALFLSERFTGSPPAIRNVKLLSKKIIYYLSWCASYGQEFIGATAPELDKLLQQE